MRPLRLLGLSTLVFITLLVVIFANYYQRYLDSKAATLEFAVTESQTQLNHIKSEFALLRGRLIAASRLLANSQPLNDYLSYPEEDSRTVLYNFWLNVADKQEWFSSIQVLGLEGQVLLAIDDLNGSKQADAGSHQAHNDVAEYFDYLINIPDGQLATWGIETSYQYGGETQLSPSLKIMMPLVYRDQRLAYLVIDIDLEQVSSRLAFSTDPTLVADLISGDGQFVNPLSRYKRADLFATQYPNFWQAMQSNPEFGYRIQNGALSIYAFVGVVSEPALYAVIHMSPEQLAQRAEQDISAIVQEAMFVVVLLLIILLPTTYLVFISSKKSLESKLAMAALEGVSAVMITDEYERTVLVNREFTRLTGYGEAHAKGRAMLDALLGAEGSDVYSKIEAELAGDRLWEGELVLTKRDGGSVAVICRIQADLSRRGDLNYYIFSFVDIDQRKRLEDQLRILSERDDLTGLWNRRKFESELDRVASLIERYPESPTYCLALIDIDHFKRINDQQGHDEGDRTIRDVAQVITRSVRDTDFVARVGGEEFALILPHTTLSEAQSLLERVLMSVANEPKLKVTVSIGYTDMTSDRQRSYKWADIALYESKALGRNRVSQCLSNEEYM
ncbi:sensor domain-containing diguanylate cyclase [Vibrio sp. WXL103]|uniref:sensor domain-containing diguanylate cyclase n=1 Tax=unclassified Vibrio TaxID=2614977 RepID=UPI003EC77264